MVDFVLATAAYNEADCIAATIDSVVGSTMRPTHWVIVDDGSTDNTSGVIGRYTERYPFITPLRLEKDEEHSFGAKVRAINTAIASLPADGWSYLGIVDADVWFEADYFERLFANFDRDPDLGVCGGLIVEVVDGVRHRQRISGSSSVAGAVQMFRRQCWQQIGEFLPLPYGAEDSAAEIIARSNGWSVRTDSVLEVLHHGPVGVGNGRPFQARQRRGTAYYHLGYHPLFQAARCVSRVFESPVVIGSALEMWGYTHAALSDDRHRLPEPVVEYLRREQLSRLTPWKG